MSRHQVRVVHMDEVKNPTKPQTSILNFSRNGRSMSVKDKDKSVLINTASLILNYNQPNKNNDNSSKSKLSSFKRRKESLKKVVSFCEEDSPLKQHNSQKFPRFNLDIGNSPLKKLGT